MKILTPLVLSIAALSGIAAATGIFYDQGIGPTEFTSVHGQSVALWGKGLYRHMSAEVAPQGIAQDVVTMILGIPLLLASLWFARKGSTKGLFVLSGTIAYFMVTYLFYMLMGMYNALFLVWVLITSLSFFALVLSMLRLNINRAPYYFNYKLPTRLIGGFLILVSTAIASLWLGIVVPPLLNGSIIPHSVAHYTTLVVQGLDLSILLPLACVSGVLLIRKKAWGYLLAPVYTIFLAILMTALSAKILAMTMLGAAVSLPVLVIPLMNLTSVAMALLALNYIKNDKPRKNWPLQKAAAAKIFVEETEINLLVFTD